MRRRIAGSIASVDGPIAHCLALAPGYVRPWLPWGLPMPEERVRAGYSERPGTFARKQSLTGFGKSVAWSSLTFAPPHEALQELGAASGWLICRAGFRRRLVAERCYGRIRTGSRLRRAFREPLEFGPGRGVAPTEPSLEAARAGRMPGPGERYTFVPLPVFSERTYEVENLNPVPAREHHGLTGSRPCTTFRMAHRCKSG